MKLKLQIPMITIFILATMLFFQTAGFSAPKCRVFNDPDGIDLGENVSMNSCVEVEGYLSKVDLQGDLGSLNESDIVLATAYTAFTLQYEDHIEAFMAFLWEDGSDAVAIDEGTITYSGNGYWVTGGLMYPPFGNLNSWFVSDPMVVELAETQATGLQLGLVSSDDSFQASLTAFNGGVEKGTDDKTQINDFVLAISGSSSSESGSFTAGASYISDISETGGDITGYQEAPPPTGLSKTVGGWGLFADIEQENFSITMEYITSASSFSVLDLVDNNDNAMKPATWNLEIMIPVKEKQAIALRYEGSQDFMDMPSSQFGIVSRWLLGEHAMFSLEYIYGRFDSSSSEANSSHTMTGQLAFQV